MKSFTLGIAALAMTTGVAFAQTTTTPSASPTAPAVTAPPAGTVPPATTTPPPNPSSPAAQLNPNNNTSTTPSAVTTSQAPSKTSAAPVKGRNSFTMGEASRRIAAGGFTQVSNLRKDRDGIWRGKAMKDGQSVNVYCDYQGNVGAQ